MICKLGEVNLTSFEYLEEVVIWINSGLFFEYILSYFF